MSAADWDGRFLASVKSLFRSTEVEISIRGPVQSEEDETAYLLESEALAGQDLMMVKPEELAAPSECGLPERASQRSLRP